MRWEVALWDLEMVDGDDFNHREVVVGVMRDEGELSPIVDDVI